MLVQPPRPQSSATECTVDSAVNGTAGEMLHELRPGRINLIKDDELTLINCFMDKQNICTDILQNVCSPGVTAPILLITLVGKLKFRYCHYRLMICRLLLKKLSPLLPTDVRSQLYFVKSVFSLLISGANKHQNRTHFVTLVSLCRSQSLFLKYKSKV